MVLIIARKQPNQSHKKKKKVFKRAQHIISEDGIL